MRLLIVDDEPVVQAYIKGAVAQGKLKAEVTYASDGDEALKLYRKHGPFDLVLTDMLHPGMDGFALVKAITQILPTQACAFMTGCDLLKKPFTLTELSEFVNQAIPKKKGPTRGRDGSPRRTR